MKQDLRQKLLKHQPSFPLSSCPVVMLILWLKNFFIAIDTKGFPCCCRQPALAQYL